MSEGVHIELLGVPVAKGRARFNRKTGHAYTPERTASAEAKLTYAAQQAMGSRAPFDGPLSLGFRAEIPIPRSWSRKKQDKAVDEILLPTTKPDLDNLLKLIKDALKGVVYRDDKQVCELRLCRKIYSDQPKLLININTI